MISVCWWSSIQLWVLVRLWWSKWGLVLWAVYSGGNALQICCLKSVGLCLWCRRSKCRFNGIRPSNEGTARWRMAIHWNGRTHESIWYMKKNLHLPLFDSWLEEYQRCIDSSWWHGGKSQFLDTDDIPIRKGIIEECLSCQIDRQIWGMAPMTRVRETIVHLTNWSKMNASESKHIF